MTLEDRVKRIEKYLILEQMIENSCDVTGEEQDRCIEEQKTIIKEISCEFS